MEQSASFHTDLEKGLNGGVHYLGVSRPSRLFVPYSADSNARSSETITSNCSSTFSSKRYPSKDDVTIEFPDKAVISSIQRIHVPQETGKPHVLPSKAGSKLVRNLRWLVFSTYRRLFTLAFIANVATLVGLAASDRLDFVNTATAASINLVVSLLMRQEHVINTLFLLSSCLPTWLPLWLRCRVAKIYAYGGLHSGCGVAAAAWYVALTGFLTQTALDNSKLWPAAGLAYGLLVLLFIIIGFAHPSVRNKMHDNFEMTHRFAGWVIVAIYWTQIVLLVRYQSMTSPVHTSFGKLLVNTPSFWCLCIITGQIFYPWIRLRRRTVYVEKLSNHAARLHFTHTNVDRCIGIRLSTNPLFESHSFATIPAARPDKGFSCVISHAGDWTRGIIREPGARTQIWTKGAPTYGVLRSALIFKRTVLVATGSGIGPLLSLLNDNQNVDCRVLWSTKDPLATYGEGIVNAVLAADPKAVILDTKTGRPDIVQQTYELYKQSGAEAIFLISNPIVTRKVIYAMETRGVPAFAPIFDS